jgi:hypothetical protein
LDLQDWREKLVFGTWVDRRINEQQVDLLVTGFKEHGLKAFTREAQLLIIIPSSSVMGSLWPNLKDHTRPPILKFTPETKVLAVAGGQHRMAALTKYQEYKTRLLTRLQVTADQDEAEAARAIKRVQDQLLECRYWGVALYDQGKPARVSLSVPKPY